MSPTVSPARACAFTVLRRVFEQGAYADRALRSGAAELDTRDRALAMQLVYGTVQRRATLDHLASTLLRPTLSELEPAVLAVLRMGLFQILFLDTIPDHAAVGESVELVKRISPGGSGLINAVLRRAAREGSEFLAGLSDDTPEHSAVMHSVPDWLAEMWWRELGPDEARALLRAINLPAESALRVNLLAATVAGVSEELPVASRPAPGLPEGLVLQGAFDAHGSALWERGAIMPQSRASMLVSRILSPEPGERLLDLCAAPGAKTTHLAALMAGSGRLTAVERHPGRASALGRTCRRMRAGMVSVQVGDALELPTLQPTLQAACDRVLVDPPCSGLGTLSSRPDLRWRGGPDAIRELAAIQAQILAAGAFATRPGGTIVYSVCTISGAEGAGVVERFLEEHQDFRAADLGSEHPEWADGRHPKHLQLLPHRDGTDGFFIARLDRAGSHRARS